MASQRLPLHAVSVGLLLALVACRTPKPAPAPPPALKVEKKPAPKPPRKRPPKATRPTSTPVPKPAPVPLDLSFLGSKTACALVLGGATLTEEEGIEVDLAQLNGAVTGAVFERLAAQGYAVEPLVVFTREAGDRSRTVTIELTRRRCNKLVQISHFLQDPTFGFLVTMLQPATDQYDPSRELWRFHWQPMAYTRRYAYRFTEDAAFELDPEEVADVIAGELAESGILARKGR